MIANRTFDRPFGGGGLEGSMASRADLRVKSLCQNSARIGRIVRISPEGNAESGVTYLGSQREARRELGFHSRSFETGLRETLTFERTLLEKSPQNRASAVRPSRVAAPTKESGSRVGAHRLFERVRDWVGWREKASRCPGCLRGWSPSPLCSGPPPRESPPFS